MKPRLWQRLGFAAVLALIATSASASFHLFKIEQIFSNGDGTVQFVVLHESEGANGENLWSGRTLTATGPGGTQTLTFQSNLPSSATANKRVLVATQGFAALGLVTPDYTVPNGFLPLVNGTVNYASVDVVSYASLPTDGATAIDHNGNPIANRATNFAGTQASVNLPPPAANYQGLWWASPPGSESGWGLNVAHQGDVIFATWFTYDVNGKDWWLSSTMARQADGSFAGDLIQTNGPPFSAVPFDPTRVGRTTAGTASLTFADANNGSFAYTVNGVSQSKAITRQAFGPLPTCVFGGLADLSLDGNYEDLWWAAPAGAEAGWGINLTQEGSTIFATWFTYDTAGAAMWLSATLNLVAPAGADPGMPGSPYALGPTAAGAAYTGRLLLTAGPPFNAVPFDPASVTRTDVGSLTLTFASGNAATMDYTVNGVTQSKPITRQVFRAPGTACS